MTTYKKTYTDKNNNKVEWEYETPKHTLTKNQQLSIDLKQTVKDWITAGFKKITLKQLEKIPIGSFVKYITKTKEKKLLAREGGFLTMIETKYIFLLNRMNNRGWSVQKSNLDQIFVKTTNPPKTDKQLKDEDKAKKEEQKKKEEEQKIKEEEQKKAEEKAKKEQQKEAKKNKDYPVKPITKKNKNDFVKAFNEVFYNQQNFVNADKLYHLLKEKYPDLKFTRKTVRQIYSQQQVNQVFHKQKTTTNQHTVIPSGKNKIWYIDLIDYSNNEDKQGRFTYKYILVCVDGFTKQVWLEPVKTKTAYNVRIAMNAILKRAKQQPNTILSDNGSEFKGVFATFLENRDIKHIHSLPATPNSNIAEIYVKKTKLMLRKIYYIQKSKEWIKHLPQIEKNIYETRHDTTGYSPKEIDDKYDEVKDIVLNRIKRKKQIKPVIHPFEVGDIVRIATKSKKVIRDKNEELFTSEQFRVKRVIRPHQLQTYRYKLEDLKGEDIKGFLSHNELVLVDESNLDFGL